MNLKILKYNISENFNVIRWCLVVMTFAFVSVVSVAKYINLSEATAINFSSLEITYLILNDPIAIIYIYLPLYVLVICGIMFDDHFGSLEIIKCGSRRAWFFNKYITLVFYTLIYFLVLIGVNYTISHQVFPYSSKWSTDFINVQVLMGQNVDNFIYSPIQTIGVSMLSVCLLYLLVGTINIFLSVWLEKEAYALFMSIGIGVLVSIFYVYGLGGMRQMNVTNFLLQFLGLCIVSGGVLWISDYIVANKDFVLQKKA